MASLHQSRLPSVKGVELVCSMIRPWHGRSAQSGRAHLCCTRMPAAALCSSAGSTWSVSTIPGQADSALAASKNTSSAVSGASSNCDRVVRLKQASSVSPAYKRPVQREMMMSGDIHTVHRINPLQ